MEDSCNYMDDLLNYPEVCPDLLQPDCRTAGFFVFQAGQRSRWYCADGIQAILVTGGAIRVYRRDDGLFDAYDSMGRGSIVVIYSGMTRYEATESGPLEMYQVSMVPASGDLRRGVPACDGLGRLPPVVDLGERLDAAVGICEGLMECCLSAKPTWRIIARSFVLQLIAACFDSVACAEGTDSEPRNHLNKWDRLLARLEAKNQIVPVPELAQAMGMSKSSFMRGFREYVGVSPQRYMQTRLLCKARQLLRAGSSVKAVALACGYRDPLYFSRQYKQQFGHAPSVLGSDGTLVGPSTSLPVSKHIRAPDIDFLNE